MKDFIKIMKRMYLEQCTEEPILKIFKKGVRGKEETVPKYLFPINNPFPFCHSLFKLKCL